VAEELARRAAVLKDVLFETTFELDRFEAALLRIARAVGETDVEVVKAVSSVYDYGALVNKLTDLADRLEQAAKECRALANLVSSKLDLERRKVLKRKPALNLVFRALKEGCRTPAAVRQFLEQNGVYVSEHTVKARLRDLVEMGLVVAEEGGYYFPVEDFIMRGERR